MRHTLNVGQRITHSSTINYLLSATAITSNVINIDTSTITGRLIVIWGGFMVI